MGCFFPRVKRQPFRDLETLRGDILAERYERTMWRIEPITAAGYTVKLIWKCEFDATKIVKKKPELLTHPVVRHSPLHTRDALYGGRTKAMRLHYKIAENEETIQYCDVMNL